MTQAGDFRQSFERLVRERGKRLAEIAGTCPEHGAYTRGQALDTGGRCPTCWEREKKRREREQRLALFAERSGVPLRFQAHTLADFVPPTPAGERTLAAIRAYAEDFPVHGKAGRCIVMAGRTGTGKTMLACSLCRHITLSYGTLCRYATAYHIVRDIKDTYGGSGRERDIVRGYVEPALLVVDEVGVQYGTDTEKLLLFEVLNGRYEEVKPTIVISNLEPAAIGDYLGDRVMDRLMDNGGAVLVFDWQSHRGRK